MPLGLRFLLGHTVEKIGKAERTGDKMRKMELALHAGPPEYTTIRVNKVIK